MLHAKCYLLEADGFDLLCLFLFRFLFFLDGDADPSGFLPDYLDCPDLGVAGGLTSFFSGDAATLAVTAGTSEAASDETLALSAFAGSAGIVTDDLSAASSVAAVTTGLKSPLALSAAGTALFDAASAESEDTLVSFEEASEDADEGVDCFPRKMVRSSFGHIDTRSRSHSSFTVLDAC